MTSHPVASRGVFAVRLQFGGRPALPGVFRERHQHRETGLASADRELKPRCLPPSFLRAPTTHPALSGTTKSPTMKSAPARREPISPPFKFPSGKRKRLDELGDDRRDDAA